MSEWIKADLLLQKLHNLRNGWSNNNIYVDGFKSAISSIEGVVEEITTEIPKWIDVNERLPKSDGNYLCAMRDDIAEPFVVIHRFYKGKFIMEKWFAENVGRAVTHWMPLPEPPKGVPSGE